MKKTDVNMNIFVNKKAKLKFKFRQETRIYFPQTNLAKIYRLTVQKVYDVKDL